MTRKKRIFLIIGVLAFMAVAGVILGVVTAGNHNADSRNSSATPGEAQADTEGKEESDVLPAVPIQAENAGATEAVTEQSGEDVSVNGNGGTQDGQNNQAKPGTNGKKTENPTTEKMTTESTTTEKHKTEKTTTEKQTTEKTTTEQSTTTEQKTTEQTTETPDDSGVVELPFVPAD